MKYSAVVSLTLALLVSCTVGYPSSAREEKVFIISIGIEYTNSMVSDLHGTVADASEIALCFADIYQNLNIETQIDLMVQKGSSSDQNAENYPSARNVLNVLDNLEPGKNDLVVFYFSGHGEKDDNGVYAACAKHGNEEFTKLYFEDLFRILNAKQSRSLVLLDCCYAGNAVDFSAPETDFSKAVSTIFAKRENQNKTAIIASCQKDSNSLLSSVATPQGKFENHSMFTIKVLETLGWEHNREICRPLYGVPVYGRLEKPCIHMTSYELTRRVTSDIKNPKQIPLTNRTDVPVLIIPYKE